MPWRVLISARSAAIESGRIDVEKLVRREGPALLDYFGRRVNNAEDAADLVGDTLVVVWRRRASVPGNETEARMWLYGVARKVLGTHRRGAVRRNDLADRLRRELVASPTSPSRAESTIQEYVRQLIGDLDEIDREIIGLVYWEGFALVEVAQILSMRPGTVRSRHARARAELRSALVETADAEGV